mmetsp:Transcript_19959/g.59775  ORF Transcript_19959/g.59775 Transcript_19959/m.59775 type:complete len:140 (-) Transcript_19959:41-460(-)
MFRLAALVPLLAMSGAAAQQKQFPSHWGAPPDIMTMDYVPLAGGYGHGSSSLSHWISEKIETDKAQGGLRFPPAFGEPPLRQSRDLRELPFGYGSGSGTLQKWLEEKALEVYEEKPQEYAAFAGDVLEGRDMRPSELVM